MFAAVSSSLLVCKTWTHSESLQPRSSCIAHKDSRAGLEGQGLGGPRKGDAAVLLTVHEEGHFLALDDHSKVAPPVGHHGHQEGGGLAGHLGAGLRVVEDDPLAAVLHAREPQAQIDDLLEGVRDGKERTAAGAAGLHPHADGEVPEEGGRDEGPGRTPDVGTRPKAVGWEATIAGDEGHGRRQRDTNELREVQVALGSQPCGEGGKRPCFTHAFYSAWKQGGNTLRK